MNGINFHERWFLSRSAALELRKALIERGVWHKVKDCMCSYHKLCGWSDMDVLRYWEFVGPMFFKMVELKMSGIYKSGNILEMWNKIPFEVKKSFFVYRFSSYAISFPWNHVVDKSYDDWNALYEEMKRGLSEKDYLVLKKLNDDGCFNHTNGKSLSDAMLKVCGGVMKYTVYNHS